MRLGRVFKSLIRGGIKNRIRMISILLLLSNLAVIGVISYVISSSSIMGRIRVTNADIVSQSMGGIDFVLKSIENSAVQAFRSLDLAEQLDKARYGDKEDKQEVDDAITEVITKLLYLRNEVDFVYIIDKDYTPGKQDGIYSNEQYARLQVINENKFRRLFKNQGDNFIWTYVVKEGLGWSPSKKAGLCRAILDKGGNYKGFILIMLREGTFEDIYSNLSQNERQVYLVDQEELVVSSTDKNSIGKVFSETFTLEDINATDVKEIDHKKYVISGAMSGYTGWKLYTVEPQENVIYPITTMKWWIVIALSTCVLVFIALSVFLSNILAKPITKLKSRVSSFKSYENEENRPDFPKDIESGEVKKRKKRINFGKKLFIMLFTIIIIPEALLMTISYYISYNIVERKYSEINKLGASQVSIKLESYLSSFEKSMYDLYAEAELNSKKSKSGLNAEGGLNSILRKIALGEGDYVIDAESEKSLSDMLLSMSEKNRDILYSQLFDVNKKLLAGFGSSNRNVPEEIFEMVDSYSETKNVWYGPYSNYYKQNVFTLGKKIKDMNDFITLGYMYVSLKETDLESVYRNTGETGNISYLIDGDGMIVSHPNKNLLGTKADPDIRRLLEANTDQAVIKGADNGNNMVSFSAIKNTGWKVVVISSMASVSQGMGKMLAGFVAVLILASISIAMITSRISKSIARPINDLSKRVRGFANGDRIPEDAEFTGGDEIEQLNDSFNNMMRRINSLIEEVYEAKLRKNEAELKSKEAELTLLQSQINPHFLYNTLEIIRWKAMFLTNGENEVTEMVSTLSDFFRLSLSKGEKIIPLKDEIAHTRNYVTIMNFRYTNKIDVQWHVDEELLDRRVPKLILQPVVENAIYHGIKPTNGKGLINIYVRRNENRIELQVMDNGVGMSSEAVERLNSEMADNAPPQPGPGKKGGYGLRNVNQRIKLTFGDKYGLYIDSELGTGTSVRIYLPETESFTE